MVNLLQFLNHVLPQKGFRCWTAIHNKRTSQGFTATNEELADKLLKIDQTSKDAYLACSSFKEVDPQAPVKPRGHDNVAYIRSFWLDIDVGPKKPYVDYEFALSELDDFCEDVGLPLATVVCSGNGIHAWWALDRDITLEEWLPVAKDLDRLAKEKNLHVDPSRTKDASSILRPIGTHNYKSTPKMVFLDGVLEPPVSYEAFVSKVTPPKLPQFETTSVDDALKERLFNNEHDYRPSYSTYAVLRCAQLKHFMDQQGNIEEPLWYANLGVLAHCVDGEDTAQVWSSGHPNYSADDTSRKLQQAKDRAGPTTCEKFKSINPASCAGCPFNVKSPIVLGQKEDVLVPPKIEEPKHWLPDNYFWGKNGEIMLTVPKKDDEEDTMDVVVCEFPFFVQAVRQNETLDHAGEESILIERRTPHEGWKAFTMSMSDLYGTNAVSLLSRYGASPKPGRERALTNLVKLLAERKKKESKMEICFNSFGWKDGHESFLVGKSLYTKTGVRTVSGTEEIERISQKLKPVKGADINKWRQAANRLFAPGCEAQGLALLYGFASPIMEFAINDGEGGAIISLLSRTGGKGKTTALAAVESIWGSIPCLRLTEGDSSTAKFRAIGLRKNLPVTIDEFGKTDVDVFADFVKSYTGGLDKNRLTRSGQSTREQLSWSNMLIGTTNTPLCDNLRDKGFHAQADRIFEVEMIVPDFVTKNLSNRIVDDFTDNAGIMGPLFISHMMRTTDPKVIKAAVNTLVDAYAIKTKSNTEQRYKIRGLACVAVAAKILSTPDAVTGEALLSFNPANIINKALDLIRQENDALLHIKLSFTTVLSDLIREISLNVLYTQGPYNPKIVDYVIYQVPKFSLLGRCEKNPARFWVPNDVLRKHLIKCKIPYSEFLRELEDMGVVVNRNKRKTISAGWPNGVPISTYCVELDLNHDNMKGVIEFDLMEPVIVEAIK